MQARLPVTCSELQQAGYLSKSQVELAGEQAMKERLADNDTCVSPVSDEHLVSAGASGALHTDDQSFHSELSGPGAEDMNLYNFRRARRSAAQCRLLRVPPMLSLCQSDVAVALSSLPCLQALGLAMLVSPSA